MRLRRGLGFVFRAKADGRTLVGAILGSEDFDGVRAKHGEVVVGHGRERHPARPGYRRRNGAAVPG